MSQTRVQDHMREVLANHELKCIAEDGKVQVWRMLRPDETAFRVQVTFSPEGIAIQGDIGFGDNQGGICSDMGYGLNWFGSQKSEDYLCEKFLRRTWQPKAAARDIKNWLKQAEEEFEKAAAEVARENQAFYTDEDFTPAEMKSDPDAWGISDEWGAVVSWRAINSLWSEGDGDRRLYELGSERIADFWDYGVGWDYPLSQAAWLCAVQQRFVELYQVILKECEADGIS